MIKYDDSTNPDDPEIFFQLTEENTKKIFLAHANDQNTSDSKLMQGMCDDMEELHDYLVQMFLKKVHLKPKLIMLEERQNDNAINVKFLKAGKKASGNE